MKTIMELLRKPWIKIIGVGLVFYFGLLSNKEDPNGLGNRLSANNLQKNFNEVQEKSRFIISNISGVPQVPENKIVANYDPLQNFVLVTTQEVDSGSGDATLKCGDEAEFSYDLRVKDSANQLEFAPHQKLIIGSNTNALLEKKITGMKVGGSRIINVPRNFQSSDNKIAFLQKFNEADLQYKVTLIKIMQPESAVQTNCKTSENNQTNDTK